MITVPIDTAIGAIPIGAEIWFDQISGKFRYDCTPLTIRLRGKEWNIFFLAAYACGIEYWQILNANNLKDQPGWMVIRPIQQDRDIRRMKEWLL